jgi:hypothetical protein
MKKEADGYVIRESIPKRIFPNKAVGIAETWLLPGMTKSNRSMRSNPLVSSLL